MRWLVAGLLCAVSLFSIVGFLASFEPGADGSPQYGWMVGYTVLGMTCLGAAGFLVFRQK